MQPRMSGAIDNATWVTDDSVPDPSPLPEPLGYQLVVRPVSIRKERTSGLIVPDQFKDEFDYLTTVGKVLAVGPEAYADPMRFKSGPWVKVGDMIAYPRFSGQKFCYKGVNLLLLNDDVPLMRVEKPGDLWPR